MLKEGEALGPALDHLHVPRGRPVLVVVGWAADGIDTDVADAVDLLLRTSILPLCETSGVVVVSGGTKTGVMAALGSAATEVAPSVVLLGVAPHSLLTDVAGDDKEPGQFPAEPRHQMLRTPGKAWGDEGAVLIKVAEVISQGWPVLMLALGGGAGTAGEIALAARRRWPVLLGTGVPGSSERAAAALRSPVLSTPAGARKRPRLKAPRSERMRRGSLQASRSQWQDLQSAAAAGCLAAAYLGDRAAISRALQWQLSSEGLLKDSWLRFSSCDVLANKRKRPTGGLVLAVLVLATLTVIAGLVAAWLITSQQPRPGSDVTNSDIWKGLATGLPLLAGVLLGVISRRGSTGDWVDLRAAAEAMLREIYRFRALADPYNAPSPPAAESLAARFTAIDEKAGGRTTAVPGAGRYRPQSWPPEQLLRRIPVVDSLVGPLTGEVYDRARVSDQLAHYEDRVKSFDREGTALAVALLAVAAAAAFLLAISWRWKPPGVYAAGAAAVAAALASWNVYRQRDAGAKTMLLTSVGVRTARARWLALPPGERERPESVQLLVEEVESALAAEGSDWERTLRQAHGDFLSRHRK